MGLNPGHVDRTADQRVERIVGAVVCDYEQAPPAQVTDARISR
jgi:hypothetical protein